MVDEANPKPKRSRPSRPQPRFEFLILADRAEVVNGKLYMMGGCWQQTWSVGFPVAYPLGLAIGMTMIPARGKSDYRLELRLDGPQGADIQPRALTFSRISTPEDLPEVPAALGVSVVAILPSAGMYTLTATLETGATKSVEFTVGLLHDS